MIRVRAPPKWAMRGHRKKFIQTSDVESISAIPRL